MLKKLRDVNVHTHLGRAKHRVSRAIHITPVGDVEKSSYALYFDQVSINQLGRQQTVDPDHVDWFNQQSNRWPVQRLLIEATYRSSVPLRNFLVVNWRKHPAH